jgi:hypothetical protein
MDQEEVTWDVYSSRAMSASGAETDILPLSRKVSEVPIGDVVRFPDDVDLPSQKGDDLVQ